MLREEIIGGLIMGLWVIGLEAVAVFTYGGFTW